jgi:hypothetical protein
MGKMEVGMDYNFARVCYIIRLLYDDTTLFVKIKLKLS